MRLGLIALLLAPSLAAAETVYMPSNPEHRAAVECIAVLSIARDAVEGQDQQSFLTLTNVQNEYYLKFDSIPTAHIDVREQLVTQRIKAGASLPALVEKCVLG